MLRLSNNFNNQNNMKKLKLSLLILFCCISNGPIWADGDSTRIVALQKEVNSLRDSLAVYQKSSAQVAQFISEAKKVAAEPWWSILLKIGLLGALAVGLLFLFLWTLGKVVPNWYTVIIQKLVERYEEMNVLKQKKKVLQLNINTASAENRRFVTNLLEEFNVVEELDITDAYIPPKEKYHIVFANFEIGFDKEKHQAILHQYIDPQVNDGKTLFALVPPGSWNFALNPALNSKVSSANVRAQVYGNLISMLKYHALTNSKW